MANGRALGSALLFDWLLGRAWDMATISYANAERFGSTNLGSKSPESGVGLGGGPSIETFLSRYAGDEAAALVRSHDRALEGQMAEVARAWSTEFQGMISRAAPTGPGFGLAVQWLGGVVRGSDGLGYVGQAHREAQADGYAAALASGSDGLGYVGQAHREAQAGGYVAALADGINARGLPVPPGAGVALLGVLQREAALPVARARVQMQADRRAEAHKLRIDAAEALIRARNEALDALMEHAFTQVHLMFDVFGRNNDYLTRLQRQEQAIRARSEIRSAELASWEARIQTTDDSQQAATQRTRAQTERANTVDGMAAEANIKLLRRYSSRAAAALNSAGISVNSTASESNEVDMGA